MTEETASLLERATECKSKQFKLDGLRYAKEQGWANTSDITKLEKEIRQNINEVKKLYRRQKEKDKDFFEKIKNKISELIELSEDYHIGEEYLEDAIRLLSGESEDDICWSLYVIKEVAEKENI